MWMCALCAEVVVDADYCYGCKSFVCETCDQVPVCGSHAVEEHVDTEPDGLDDL